MTVLKIPCNVLTFACNAKATKVSVEPLGEHVDELSRYVGGRVTIVIDPHDAWPGAIRGDAENQQPLFGAGRDE